MFQRLRIVKNKGLIDKSKRTIYSNLIKLCNTNKSTFCSHNVYYVKLVIK